MKHHFLTGFAALSVASTAFAADDLCGSIETLNEGMLTIATSEPAFSPWVLDNAPESGQGFEAAMAKELAMRMGFDEASTKWVRASFDQSIQPGPKDFDVNLQQFSITAERDEVVDFSVPYYSAAMAVVVLQPAVDEGLEASTDSLRGLKWGAHAATTAPKAISDFIAPESDPLLYEDTVDVVEAMKANQIDAAMFDLPTALYVTAVMLDNGVVLGQFEADSDAIADQFGLLMEEGSALKPCVDSVVASMHDDGTLGEIEAKWLSDETGIPVIEIASE